MVRRALVAARAAALDARGLGHGLPTRADHGHHRGHGHLPCASSFKGPLVKTAAGDADPIMAMEGRCFHILHRSKRCEVPLLNLTDCVITFCITLMVTTSSMFLPAVEGAMIAFAHGVSTAMLSGIFAAIGIMSLMTASALVYRGAMGSKKERFWRRRRTSIDVSEPRPYLSTASNGISPDQISVYSVFWLLSQ